MTLRSFAAVAYRDVYVNRLIASSLIPGQVRGRMLNRLGHNIHPTAGINPHQFIGAKTGLTVGAHSVINYGCFFDLGAATTLGAGVGIGYGVMIITCGHEIGGPEQRWSTPTTAPVVIDDGAWVGARSVILPGVTIGAGCVIAAGSVVTSDCEPNSFYAGVPARLKRRFPEGGTVDGAVRTQAGR